MYLIYIPQQKQVLLPPISANFTQFGEKCRNYGQHSAATPWWPRGAEIHEIYTSH